MVVVAAGAALGIALVAVLALVVISRRAAKAMRAAEDQVCRLGQAAVAELEAVGLDAAERLDRAVARAEAAVASAETAARIADAALTAPVVKARAWSAGTAAAARTFRERRSLRAGSD